MWYVLSLSQSFKCRLSRQWSWLLKLKLWRSFYLKKESCFVVESKAKIPISIVKIEVRIHCQRRWKHRNCYCWSEYLRLWVVSIHGWQLKCNPKLPEVWFITQDTYHQCSRKLVKEETYVSWASIDEWIDMRWHLEKALDSKDSDIFKLWWECTLYKDTFIKCPKLIRIHIFGVSGANQAKTKRIWGFYLKDSILDRSRIDPNWQYPWEIELITCIIKGGNDLVRS